jgi:hypothetical protein
MVDPKRRRLAAQLFAISDMYAVVSAAHMLVSDIGEQRLDSGDRLALETGLVVSYARPFTQSRGGYQLQPADEPDDEDARELHEWLLAQRNRVYAHTDETEARRVLELAEADLPPLENFNFRQSVIEPMRLGRIAAMATALAYRYKAAAELERSRLAGERPVKES